MDLAIIDALRVVIREELQPVREDISKLNQRMDKLESKMDKLESRMDKLESRMDKLEGRIDKIEKRIDNIESEVAALKVDVKYIKVQVDENTQILKALEHQTKVNKSENDRLVYEAAKIEADLNSIKSDVRKGIEAYNFIQELKQFVAR
ncbi:DUF2730 family protein [Thermobrachium celere]|uniref:DUF2730 family protein n=1 Tax=Thermobrachium celere TaxID=53422 RepID=UPI0019451691|nr:DUF2730 family protein [Thermobrachium celere]GFR36641.1 hypothetical protein TCEA9_24530 [Thermobrachium celere]